MAATWTRQCREIGGQIIELVARAIGVITGRQGSTGAISPFHHFGAPVSGFTSLFVYTRYPFFGAVGNAVRKFEKRKRKRLQFYSGICWKSSNLAFNHDAEHLRATMIDALVQLDPVNVSPSVAEGWDICRLRPIGIDVRRARELMFVPNLGLGR